MTWIIIAIIIYQNVTNCKNELQQLRMHLTDQFDIRTSKLSPTTVIDIQNGLVEFRFSRH